MPRPRAYRFPEITLSRLGYFKVQYRSLNGEYSMNKPFCQVYSTFQNTSKSGVLRGSLNNHIQITRQPTDALAQDTGVVTGRDEREQLAGAYEA